MSFYDILHNLNFIYVNVPFSLGLEIGFVVFIYLLGFITVEPTLIYFLVVIFSTFLKIYVFRKNDISWWWCFLIILYSFILLEGKCDKKWIVSVNFFIGGFTSLAEDY